ncbi:hypothetical protein GCM10027160_23850 [Streptomyces calidiresistens]|uniref:Uncharacterized protein n=1 Tax=Streptomyces calidiresistens TaxID=1485586 RepID=A0A7W3T8F2_9ACTN|nr:hypothetical protein [Streptomyces calidiresistens]MBB0232571.1 hypothetical protein [Streptomyces calidiresistens]
MHTNPAFAAARRLHTLTTIADARAALALARGTHPDRIAPSGHDISDHAYATVRDQHRTHYLAHPTRYTLRNLENARALWARHRPDLTDDWTTGLPGIWTVTYEGASTTRWATEGDAHAELHDLTRADAPGRAWDLYPDGPHTWIQVWTCPDTDRPLDTGPGRITHQP